LRDREVFHIAIELQIHLNAEVARGVALTPTRCLARGSLVIDTGQPVKVPVGMCLLGRVFNVFGEPIDRKGDVKEAQWRSNHQDPVPISYRATTSEIFETGIKAIDVLASFERGGKAGFFGGSSLLHV
jgi:F-type H+-transporting ATPase subunit beta